MADIFDKVQQQISDGVSSRKVFTDSSPLDSILKTQKEDKQTSKTAITSAPNDVVQVETATPTKAPYSTNLLDKSSIVSADYYRNGRKDSNGSYIYAPRSLSEPENEEVASIRLLGQPTENSKSEPKDLIPPFSKFFLESYQEGHMERSQIVETFGDFYVFFFGERPPVYTFSGTLLNTKDINWKEDFMFYYDKFLRGTKCVEYKAKILLTYGFNQVEGFILSVNTQAHASNDKGVQVSWQVLVTDRKQMKLSLDFGLTESNGVFNQDPSILNLLTKGVSDPIVSDSNKHAKEVVTGNKNPSKAKVPVAADLNKIKSVVDPKSTTLSTVNGKIKAVLGI